jgi:protein-tyrosine phosphatase
MAEIIARQLLSDLGLTDIELDSAGTLEIEGRPASDSSVRAVAEIGLDLSDHRSQGLVACGIEKADLVFVMAPEHEHFIRSRFPQKDLRICRLWEYTKQPGRLSRIEDPIGQPFGRYVSCREDIRECLIQWLDEFAGCPKG